MIRILSIGPVIVIWTILVFIWSLICLFIIPPEYAMLICRIMSLIGVLGSLWCTKNFLGIIFNTATHGRKVLIRKSIKVVTPGKSFLKAVEPDPGKVFEIFW